MSDDRLQRAEGRAVMQLGFSLKLYFDRAATCVWTSALVEAVASRPTLSRGLRVWVAPATPFLADVHAICSQSSVQVAAQNVDAHGRGAFTGGICAQDLVDIGARHVVIGHAERRAQGESDVDVAAKAAACTESGLAPVLCVGEPTRMPAPDAAAYVVDQARSIGQGAESDWTIAYEPVWAIGAAEPAAPEHIRAVCDVVRASLPGVPIVYGGSARPGLLQELAPSVDGLFLGRFAHDPSSFGPLLDDVEETLLEHEARSSSGAGTYGASRS